MNTKHVGSANECVLLLLTSGYSAATLFLYEEVVDLLCTGLCIRNAFACWQALSVDLSSIHM